MNILFITNGYPPLIDGVGDYTFNIAQQFADEGHRVVVCCRYSEHIAVQSGAITVLPVIGRWGRRATDTIVEIIDIYMIDLVSLQYVPHAFDKKGLPLSIIGLTQRIKRLGVTLFTFCHEVYVEPEWGSPKRILVSYLMQYISARIVRNSDIVATSIAYYRDMIERITPSAVPVTTIPIASNVPSRYISPTNRNSLRSQFAQDGELLISFFGLRDIGSSLAAIEQLRNDGYRINILLIGKLPPNLPQELPQHTYKTGTLDICEIDPYLQISDLLILPESSVGGCSFKSGSLAAAMRSGLPVVTACGAMTDHSMIDRENILFADFGSIDSIKRALIFLSIKSTRDRVGHNAKLLVADHTWERCYKDYIRLIGYEG